jgi:hypothetical protein
MSYLAILKSVIAMIPDLAKITTIGKKSRKIWFDDFLAPLHLEMDKIRESYMGIFITFRKNLTSARNANGIRAAIEQFIIDREPVIEARAKVRSGFADQTSKIWQKKVRDCVWKANYDDEVETQLVRLVYYTNNFFLGTSPRQPMTSLASRLMKEIDVFRNMSDDDLRKISRDAIPLLTKVIDQMLSHMAMSWERASEAYHAIKLYYR